MNKNTVDLDEKSQLIKMLQDFICEASRDRLINLSQRNDIAIRELRAGDSALHHPWAFSIYVELGRGRIIFRSFFSTDVGSSLANLDTSKDTKNISLESCHVLFGEFCNLVGGAAKYTFQESFRYFSKPLLGLPAKQHGGDFTFEKFNYSKEYERIWGLEWNGQSIICASLIQIDEEGIKDLIKEVKERKITSLKVHEGGDVELF